MLRWGKRSSQWLLRQKISRVPVPVFALPIGDNCWPMLPILRPEHSAGNNSSGNNGSVATINCAYASFIVAGFPESR
jgi:hypothetical protein